MLVLAIFSFANAQKGSVLVAGNIGFNSQKNSSLGNESKQNYFNFSPKVGYQFLENMTVGIESNIQSYKTSISGNTYDNKYNQLQLGAFLRYSKPLGGVFSAYADLSAGMLANKTSISDPLSTSFKSSGLYFGITPAVFIDLKKSFGLNFSIGGIDYSSIKDDTAAKNKTTGFAFSFGNSFNIGISKNF
ncbi:MAG TPA: outer membrane beta-barrel protein [Flavobacterium sp.]|uniref:outer membrane beta-barrel protein n=1 Tax=Flavobacterium sp. TaxID=239 RepID=UPI002F3F4234